MESFTLWKKRWEVIYCFPGTGRVIRTVANICFNIIMVEVKELEPQEVHVHAE